jgi:very-short-patch-repair endonuclease
LTEVHDEPTFPERQRASEEGRIEGQLDVWRRELIGLTRANRLLYFRRTKVSTLEILSEGVQLHEIFADLAAGRSWGFRPAAAGGPTDETDSGEPHEWPVNDRDLLTDKPDAKTLSASLSSLHRRATQEFMEKGIWILYLAVGILHWIDPETGEEAESPVILVPVELQRENIREPFRLVLAEEDVVLNPALAVKLAEFGVNLPSIEGDEVDIEAILGSVSSTVSSQAHWEVQPRLVLALFSFHKEVMYRDLLKNEGIVAASPLVRALALGVGERGGLDFDLPPEEELDEVSPPEQVVTILDADATQRQCIHAAAEGRSFVMDGPPGTGKSQTISNMIAELLAKGRTVLFVSEKAAALEVVHKRLLAAGLADFCLELHSHKATRKEVAQELGRALNRHPVVPTEMDIANRSRLVRLRRDLSLRSEVMNSVREPLGRSLQGVLGRITQLQHLEQAPPPEPVGLDLSADRLTQILALARALAQAWTPVERGRDFVWRNLVDAHGDSGRRQRSSVRIEDAQRRLRHLEAVSSDAAEALLVHRPEDFSAVSKLDQLLEHMEVRPPGVAARWLTGRSMDEVQSTTDERHGVVLAYQRCEKALLELVGDGWSEIAPDAAASIERAGSVLGSLPIPTDLPPEEYDTARFALFRDFLAWSATELTAIDADATELASAFGLDAGSLLSADRAGRLADLVELSGYLDRPEGAWLNRVTLHRAHHAVEVLGPACTALRERRDQLSATFMDDVLQLDLQGLVLRFQQLHHGIGKLRSQYRADKKALAAVTHIGKVTPDVVALLPAALEWQRNRAVLAAVESSEAAVLGPHYYRSVDTDFTLLDQALAVAERALDLVEGALPSAAVRLLERTASPHPELLARAGRIKERLSAWGQRAEAAGVQAEFTHDLTRRPLGEAMAWCASAVEPIGVLAEVADSLSAFAGRHLSFEEMCSACHLRSEAEEHLDELATTAVFDSELLGALYRGIETNWDSLVTAVEWASTMRDRTGGPVPMVSAERFVEVEPVRGPLIAALNQWNSCRDEVLHEFIEPYASELKSDLSGTFEDARDLLAHLGSTIGDIEEWVEFERLRAQLSSLGLSEPVSYCVDGRVTADHVAGVIERACLERWADMVIETERERLGFLRSDQLDNIVREFQVLDRELIARAPATAIARCNAGRPRTTVGAAGIVAREAAKSRRHMPVRSLLDQSGEVAQALKPCFMMTPLTVSQFLPPRMRFDAVIFDEASQVRPSDAINCVYRGDQLIVAGDEKQLPPTSFFESLLRDGDDEWEEEQYDDFESVLELAKGTGGFRQLPLRWHYRSQHEDLIAYSNYSFYDGRLITFPSAQVESEELGVKLFPVEDGQYRRGGARDNPREAEVVAERVMYWAGRAVEDPARAPTVGVVAFSEAQANTIELAVEPTRLESPELESFFADDRLDGFFVKNLENVQGDERDVMIFSVGYGRDEVGKFTMNFGPLNRSGGVRRLNVAITRARMRVELVASVTGRELEFEANENPAVRHLQRYLTYAVQGPKVLALEVGEEGRDAESPFEEEVIHVIRSWGYDVVPQVGTAGYRVDIGVKDPRQSGRFLLGVECDGAMYHSSKAARDRDRLREEILRHHGWNLHRVWSTAWYRDRPEAERRLRSAIEAAVRGDGEGTAATSLAGRATTPRQEFTVVSLDAHPSWAIPYRVADVTTTARFRYEMHEEDAFPELRSILLGIVEVEGPIEDELLLRRAREAWHVGRAGSRIREAFRGALYVLEQGRKIKRIEQRFSYIAEEQLARVRVPTGDERSHRSADQICLRERKLAVLRLLEEARAASHDELTLALARLFGWNRRGHDIQLALSEAVIALMNEGTLVDDGSRIRISGQ